MQTNTKEPNSSGSTALHVRRRRAAGRDLLRVGPLFVAGFLLRRLPSPWGPLLGFLTFAAAAWFLWRRDENGASPGKRAEGLCVAGDFRRARNLTLAFFPAAVALAEAASLLFHFFPPSPGPISGMALAVFVGPLVAACFLGMLVFILEGCLVLAGRKRLADAMLGTSVRMEDARGRS